MNEFEEEIQRLVEELPDEARELTKHVLDQELRSRFGDRSQLPATFATTALKAAKAANAKEATA